METQLDKVIAETRERIAAIEDRSRKHMSEGGFGALNAELTVLRLRLSALTRVAEKLYVGEHIECTLDDGSKFKSKIYEIIDGGGAPALHVVHDRSIGMRHVVPLRMLRPCERGDL